MSEPAAPNRVAVKCERHGLHFNPALHDGCALCRREAAETSAGAPRGGAVSGSEAARLRNAWLVALALVVAVALGLTFVEGSVLRTIIPFAPTPPALAPTEGPSSQPTP